MCLIIAACLALVACAAQAAELIAPLASPGKVLLDAGCGSGYFFHSLASRSIPLKYIGIDATSALLQIGKQELPAFGLPEENLKVMRLEDLNGRADFVLCMNTLTYMDNYYRPLDRLLQVTQKYLILRESISDQAKYSYVKDDYLDPGVDLKVHINTYDKDEVDSLIEGAGFEVVHFSTKGSDIIDAYAHNQVILKQQQVADFLKENCNALQAMIDASGSGSHMRFVVRKD